MKAKINLMISILFLVNSCQKENQPPVIQSITASSSTLKTGETTQLTCVATDPDGDQLTYSWSSGKGTFPSGITGVSVAWKAPGEADAYSIAVDVNDGKNVTRGYVKVVVEDHDYVTFTDSRDNKTYKTLEIGDQTWMAENLAYLPSVSPSSQGSGSEPYYYVYDNEGTNVAYAITNINYKTYGVLYNWPAAMAEAGSSHTNPNGVQGVCPVGWHLPSDDEWTQLQNYLIANGYNYDGTTTGNKIAKSLAATTKWNPYSRAGVIGNNLLANNKSGFSALPVGIRNYGNNATFAGFGYSGYWWSSTEYDSSYVWYRGLHYHLPDVSRAVYHKAHGFSVRCIKD